MVFTALKKSLASLVLATSLSLSATPVKAELTVPDHMYEIHKNRGNAKRIVFGVNVGLGCLKSGIGSYVNDSGFFKGCLQGSMGGAIAYYGKYVASFAHPDKGLYLAGLGKSFHDFGVSLSDNVMRGEDMFSQYQTDLGPLVFTFRDGIVPRLSFTLTPVSGVIRNVIDGNSFDLKSSLYALTPVFRLDSESEDNWKN